jgi:hypothetical protein
MPMLELGVVLLVKGITEVCGDSFEETFPNVPAGTGAFPLLFWAFTRVGGCEIGDCGIIGGRFGFFDVGVDAGLVFILGAAYDLGK